MIENLVLTGPDEKTLRSESGPGEPSSWLDFQVNKIQGCCLLNLLMFLSTTAPFALELRIPQKDQNWTMELHSPVMEKAEETREEEKPEPQSEEKH